MVNFEQLQKYRIYLQYLEKKLSEYFKEQSPYIYCKAGCSSCCEKGEYPFTEIEFSYLMLGVQTLSPDIISKIDENIKRVKKEKEECKEKKFLHACPFLVDKKCSLYDFRGIICRSHGLAFFDKNKHLLVPACVDEGLNYSNVYDFETKTISSEKYKQTGIEQEPLAHNVGVYYLTNNEITKELGLDFGEIKPMSYWFLREG